MAKFTTEVRSICEAKAKLVESVGYDDVTNVVRTAAPLIFEKFPIFDESYRLTLEEKILRHFYTREIGFETVGLWQLHLNNKMREIMPYYNKLYESETLKFNPLTDVDMETVHDRYSSGEKEKTGENKNHYHTTGDSQDAINIKETNENDDTLHSSTVRDSDDTYTPNNLKTTEKNAFSDTPQSHLVGVEDRTYLTDYREIQKTQSGSSTTSTAENAITDNERSSKGTNARTETSENNRNSITEQEGDNKEKSSESNLETYSETIKGKRTATSFAKMLSEYRDTFLNIDLMIIKELEPLFFGLWY